MLNKTINLQEYSDFYGSTAGSHVKVDREYLLKKGVARQLNTYLGFGQFDVFGDIMTDSERNKWYQDKSGKADPKVGAPGAKSIFNKYGAVLTGGLKTDSNLNISEFRLGNNVPLIDTPENRKLMRQHSNCTIRELVEASQTGQLGRATYSYSDFMYCKYLGSIPNNYLITLRRFPTPVDDYISTIGKSASLRKELSSSNSLSTGQLVTWLNTPGNDLESILTYSTAMPFEEKQAQWEDASVNADNNSKPLNAIACAFDDKYRAQVSAGYAGAAIFQNDYVAKVFHTNGADAPYSGFLGWRDQNKVYGPIYAVKSTYYPSDKGLSFNQSFKLTFEYELRSYNGINGRQAMLDLLSNILQVTYSTGTFWGGGYRSTGAHQNNMFANLKIMNTKGGFTDFVDAFFQDASNIIDTKFGKDKFSWKNLGKSVLNFFNNLGGMLAAATLNKLGRPQKAMANSLLSPAPVGLWHVTIGNPFHPIMTMGNMILKNTTITHTGPLGIDDFPTGLKVECELERGKPRDLRGIEMLYMNGNDRIYFPMGDKIARMYAAAKDYKVGGRYEEEIIMDQSGKEISNKKTEKVVGLDSDAKPLQYESELEKAKDSVIKFVRTVNNSFASYFGADDESVAIITAKEQEYGSQPPTPPPPANGGKQK